MGKGLTLFVFEGPQAENVVAGGLFRDFFSKPVPLVCVRHGDVYSLQAVA